MSAINVKIESSWKELLNEEFEKPYFGEIKAAILKSKSEGHKVYPPGNMIFRAFDATPVADVKVVILGQDPYHRPGQAMGLSFSVPRGVRTPPSLKNIYKEMVNDVDFKMVEHGDLTSWSEQGVFLLNAFLTVEKGNPTSHSRIGWQHFTDAVISKLSAAAEGVVFMLWGNFAKGKAELIDDEKHLILEAAHPSPLAGNRYQGCGHFSAANKYLQDQGKEPINWQLPSQ